jgi:Fe-S cluster biogenesis protein NfuA
VANLLMLHGLHPDDVHTRVQAALDRVRPYLGSHAGGVEFLGVDDQGVAQLQLKGSCDGCAGSAATVHNAVERAVLDAAPEVVSVHVEGVVEPKPASPGLLQIGMHCPDGLAEAVGA